MSNVTLPAVRVPNTDAFRVPEIEPTDMAMLERIVPLYDKLERALPPAERHEVYRELATLYFTMSTRMAAKGWDLIFKIEADGSWKLETEIDPDTDKPRPKYTQFADWCRDFFAPIHRMSEMTTKRRIKMARFLIQDLNVSPELAATVMDDKPYLLEKAMTEIVFDEATGQAVGLKPQARLGLAHEFGLEVAEIPTEDCTDFDRGLMKRLVGHLEAADHHEASAMVTRSMDPISVWIEVDLRNKELHLVGRGRLPGYKSIQTFKYVFVLKHQKQHIHQAAWDYLKQRFRRANSTVVRPVEEAEE